MNFLNKRAISSLKAGIEKCAIAALPDPSITVSEWSDKNRILSAVTSSEPGNWRTERTPYLKEIMDVLSPSDPTREIVFQKGSQIGGSEAGLNWIGFLIDRCPGPTMLVQPTVDLAKRFSRQRLDQMLRDTASLQGKIRTKKSRDSTNTALMKEYDGGIMVISGANSAVALRSMPVKNSFLDEIDGYPEDVDGEGDPVKLAEKRTATFGMKKKIFKNSTPTIKNKSRIEAAYLHSDQRRFHIPCPLCDAMQIINWDKIRWENNDPTTVYMQCGHCKGKIEEIHKTKMLKNGKWIKGNTSSKTAGFHLSALYSPLGWYSWEDAVKEFLEAKSIPMKLRVFVNTVLGETWAEKGDAPEWRLLFERREQYKFNALPKDAIFVTAGVDVQRDRFECEIVAWGQDKQSWSLDYRMIMADTSLEESYKQLDEILAETFPVEDSTARVPVSMMAIDSGFNTHSVYNFARTRKGRVMAIKGMENIPTALGGPSAMDVSHQGKKISRGVYVWPVGVSFLKTEFYSWLNLHKPTEEGKPFPPGFCHFPEYPEDYFKMLTAEQIVVRLVRGYRRYVWEKIRERNESLDARIYARAAASNVGLDRFNDSDWNLMREALRSRELPSGPVEVKKTKGGITFKKSEFL